MAQNNVVSKFLSKIIEELESLSEGDIKRLESGDYSLSLRVIKDNSFQEEKSEIEKVNVKYVLEELKSCKDRDAGYDVLHRNFKSKRELEWFARQIDVYVMKQDKIDKIKDKIIEGTIGALLRSNAIQKIDT